jgi:glycosyltransferase involved in cell wall biosynthesis
MNILLINKFFYDRGGAEKVFFNTADIFKQNKHDVSFFSMEHDRNKSYKYDKYFVSNIDMKKGGNLFSNIGKFFRILYSREAKEKLNNFIIFLEKKNKKPDIAILHNIYHEISPSILGVLSKHNIKIFLTLHDFFLVCPNYKMYNSSYGICEKCKYGKYSNCVKNKCVDNDFLGSFAYAFESFFSSKFGFYNKVDKFIAPSLFMKNKMIEWGIPENRLVHINNPILDFDIPKIKKENYFLYLGRISEEKGIDVAISAFAKMPNERLIILGEGPKKDELEKFIVSSNIKNIEFLGYKNNEEVKRYILKSKATICPSSWYENQPMSILESFLCKRLVIGSDIGGIKELVGKDERGFLFKMNDAYSLKAKIEEFSLLPKEEIERKEDNARKFVLENFSGEEYLNKIMNIL